MNTDLLIYICIYIYICTPIVIKLIYLFNFFFKFILKTNLTLDSSSLVHMSIISVPDIQSGFDAQL